MDFQIAIQLVERGVDQSLKKQSWADLGAGTGLFSKALASLLDNESFVFAIDRDERSLNQIADEFNQVVIKKIKIDFSKEKIATSPFDGILMANSLHFVQKQSHLLSDLKHLLKPDGRMILIEYDMDKSNPWVPYPISYITMIKLAKSAGFESVIRLGETPSTYNRTNIYSVLLK